MMLFNGAFGASENTLLVRNRAFPLDGQAGGNASEPVYLPADDECPRNRIVFAHGFFSSALHEIAHWSLAGAARRRLVDYGYWYAPDGRDAAQQIEFERVEARPQAIEWAFCMAAGFEFQVSVDNLSGCPVDRGAFREKVRMQLRHFLAKGFPPRAQTFIDVLSRHYRREFRTASDV